MDTQATYRVRLIGGPLDGQTRTWSDRPDLINDDYDVRCYVNTYREKVAVYRLQELPAPLPAPAVELLEKPPDHTPPTLTYTAEYDEEKSRYASEHFMAFLAWAERRAEADDGETLYLPSEMPKLTEN